MESHDRLRRARIEAGFSGPDEAATRFGWNRNTYKSNENGNAPFSFKKAKDYAEAFGVRPEWLYDGTGAIRPNLVSVIGKVGADPEGRVFYSTGQGTDDMVPPPPGGSSDAVALEVIGHSMRGWADDGSLIYFETQKTPPTPDMIGYPAIVETVEGHVLLKRLLKGSRRGLYDLESINGPTLEDQELVWAAEVIAVIPPKQARRIIRRRGEAA